MAMGTYWGQRAHVGANVRGSVGLRVGPEQERVVWVSPGLHESGVGVAQERCTETHGEAGGLQLEELQSGKMPTYPVPALVFLVQALGCKTTHSNQEVLQTCSLVFFATKPHILPAVLAEVAPVVTSEHILVSLAAGVSLSTLEEVSGL